MTEAELYYALEDWKNLKTLERDIGFRSADVNVINASKTATEWYKLPWDIEKKPRMPEPEEWAKWDMN